MLDVTQIEGATIELSGTSLQDPNDYADSRSFVLMAIADEPGPELSRALGALDYLGRGNEPSFYEEHVSKFVSSTQLVGRTGIVEDTAARANERDEVERRMMNEGMTGETLRAAVDSAFPPPTFVLRATMTSPKWLKGLRVGMKLGTTAYDVWEERRHGATAPAQQVPGGLDVLARRALETWQSAGQLELNDPASATSLADALADLLALPASAAALEEFLLARDEVGEVFADGAELLRLAGLGDRSAIRT